jgi:hypothetical protein
MPAVYKLLFFFLIWVAAFVGCYYAFRFLNKKIKESHTGWGIAKYSILLFLVCAVLFAGALLLLNYGYVFLAGKK